MLLYSFHPPALNVRYVTLAVFFGHMAFGFVQLRVQFNKLYVLLCSKEICNHTLVLACKITEEHSAYSAACYFISLPLDPQMVTCVLDETT